MWRNVALVATFIDDDRLSELLAPDSCLPHLQPSCGLDAQVRDPRLCVVIKRKAVVDRAEVLVGIVPRTMGKDRTQAGLGLYLNRTNSVGSDQPEMRDAARRATTHRA